MEKFVKKVLKTRESWWQAFKAGCRLKGYQYYKYPNEIKYRFPAPGQQFIKSQAIRSHMQDSKTRPHLYKQHYTTPYRDSRFNIRPIQKSADPDDYISNFSASDIDTTHPDFQQVRKMPMSHVEHKEVQSFDFSSDPEKASNDLHQMFGQMYNEKQKMRENVFRRTDPDLNLVYEPKIYGFADRGALGLDHMPVMKMVVLELEKMIQDTIVAPKQKSMKLEFYKGNTRKWMIGDDHLSEVSYFTTHFFNVIQDGLGSTILPQFQGWGINFLKAAYIKFWNDRYKDFVSLNALYLSMMEYIQANGFVAFVEMASAHVYSVASLDLEYFTEKLRMQWASMYPGQFEYYRKLFMMSCPFSYEYMKLTYF